MEGKTIQDIIEAVHKYIHKHQSSAKRAALKEWLWHFTAHVAHGLAQASSTSQSLWDPCMRLTHMQMSVAICSLPIPVLYAEKHRFSRLPRWAKSRPLGAASLTGCMATAGDGDDELSMLTSVSCAMQVLSDLHKQRSHRDLKPQNIMVAQSRRGRVTVKLVDFAASRTHGQSKHYNLCIMMLP